MTMDIKDELAKIAAKQGLSVGFDDIKRVRLTDQEKAKIREDIENSVDATYRGPPMPMTQGDMPSGLAHVSIGVLRRLISKFELVPSKLENAFGDVANGTAMVPCITYDQTDDCVVIEQGRHRITAMHDLGYQHTMLSYPAEQRDKLQAILGGDFASL